MNLAITVLIIYAITFAVVGLLAWYGLGRWERRQRTKSMQVSDAWRREHLYTSGKGEGEG